MMDQEGGAEAQDPKPVERTRWGRQSMAARGKKGTLWGSISCCFMKDGLCYRMGMRASCQIDLAGVPTLRIIRITYNPCYIVGGKVSSGLTSSPMTSPDPPLPLHRSIVWWLVLPVVLIIAVSALVGFSLLISPQVPI
jgi:hypothetical protein